MPRWLKILVGPLPATVTLIPFLLAGGVGLLIAMYAHLQHPINAPGEPWSSIADLSLFVLWIMGAAVGVGALWLAILVDSPEALRRAPLRWLLIAALLAGLVSETRWIFVMAGPSGMAGHTGYGIKDLLVWLVLLLGPLIQSLYYLAKLIRP